MKPAYVRKAPWYEVDINWRVSWAAATDAASEVRRAERLSATLGRPIPYAECLKRLLARD